MPCSSAREVSACGPCPFARKTACFISLANAKLLWRSLVKPADFVCTKMCSKPERRSTATIHATFPTFQQIAARPRHPQGEQEVRLVALSTFPQRSSSQQGQVSSFFRNETIPFVFVETVQIRILARRVPRISCTYLHTAGHAGLYYPPKKRVQYSSGVSG